ncbi:glycosyltransferase [Photobacterium satsumensis]|uniref:glycosyltransferase n=1 Tax=Photobacterium satsumensis TaxID=2910239 RepID=UPI003D0ABA92
MIKNKVHVVIVDFFKGEKLLDLLKCLDEQDAVFINVIVIDNSMSDDNFSVYSSFTSKSINIEFYQSPCNLGYSKACNIGATKASSDSDFILFLNPDIYIKDSRLIKEAIDSYLSLNNVGSLGVSQENPDGTYENVARSFPQISSLIVKRVPLLSKIFSDKLSKYLSVENTYNINSQLQPVDWLQSSFLLIDIKTWTELGGFNERYYIFMADVDIGKRIQDFMKYSYLDRSLVISADGVRSSNGGLKNIFSSKVLRLHIIDAIKYFLSRKNN